MKKLLTAIMLILSALIWEYGHGHHVTAKTSDSVRIAVAASSTAQTLPTGSYPRPITTLTIAPLTGVAALSTTAGVCTSLQPIPSTCSANKVQGDVDCNGVIDITDLTAYTRIVNGFPPKSDGAYTEDADVNRDCEVGIKDRSVILTTLNSGGTPIVTPTPIPTATPVPRIPTLTVTIAPTTPPAGTVTLNMTEIAKHNTGQNCWMLISGKVYNITNFIVDHPGGSIIKNYCGIDATVGFKTKGSKNKDHHASTYTLLNSYYLGDLNAVVSVP